jgi:hypothetical protein
VIGLGFASILMKGEFIQFAFYLSPSRISRLPELAPNGTGIGLTVLLIG